MSGRWVSEETNFGKRMNRPLLDECFPVTGRTPAHALHGHSAERGCLPSSQSPTTRHQSRLIDQKPKTPGVGQILNLYIQFDEQRLETAPSRGLRHWQCESRRQQRLFAPTATAPAVDSTARHRFVHCVHDFRLWAQTGQTGQYGPRMDADSPPIVAASDRSVRFHPANLDDSSVNYLFRRTMRE